MEEELTKDRGRAEAPVGYPVHTLIDLLVQNVMQRFSSEYEHLRTAQVKHLRIYR